MKKLQFVNYKINVIENNESRVLNIDDFVRLPNNNISLTIDDTTYDVSLSKLDDDFIWLYVRFGNPFPCTKDLYDKEQKIYCENNRGINQVEMNRQLFALYSINKHVLYCNNSQKRNFIQQLLSQILQLNIEITSHYVSIEAFEKKIKQLDVIRFKSADNLFTSGQAETLNHIFKDTYGIDTNIEFTIEIKCKDNGQNWFTTALNKLNSAKNNYEIQELTLIGKNTDEFEEIFNEGTFIKKFENYFKENEEGLINSDDVLQYLLNRIKDV